MFLSAAVIWTDGQFRVFAVTIPFFAAAFGIILSARFSNTAQVRKKSFIDTSTQATPWETTTTYLLSYTLLTAGLVGPLFIKAINMADITPNFSCTQNETAIVTRNISGTPHIDLLKNSEQFKKTLVRSALEVQQPFLKVLEPNFSSNTTAVGLIYDVQSASTQFIIAPLNVFQSKTKWMGLCTTKIPGIENTITQVKSYGALSEK